MQFIFFKSLAYFQDEKSRWAEVYLFGYRIEQWGQKEIWGCVLYAEIGGNFWPLKTEAKREVWTGGLGQFAGPLTTLFETMVWGLKFVNSGE